MNRTIRTARLLAPPIVALSALTACGGDDTTTATAPPITASPTTATAPPISASPSTPTPTGGSDEEAAEPDRPFESTTWTVDSTITDQGVSSAPPGASLRFLDGELQFDSGCNSGGGEYTIAGDVVTVGSIIHTERACADNMDLEATMIDVLAQPLTIQITAGHLTMTARDGTGLGLTAG